jgi:hypothetical protein
MYVYSPRSAVGYSLRPVIACVCFFPVVSVTVSSGGVFLVGGVSGSIGIPHRHRTIVRHLAPGRGNVPPPPASHGRTLNTLQSSVLTPIGVPHRQSVGLAFPHVYILPTLPLHFFCMPPLHQPTTGGEGGTEDGGLPSISSFLEANGTASFLSGWTTWREGEKGGGRRGGKVRKSRFPGYRVSAREGGLGLVPSVLCGETVGG